MLFFSFLHLSLRTAHSNSLEIMRTSRLFLLAFIFFLACQNESARYAAENADAAVEMGVELSRPTTPGESGIDVENAFSSAILQNQDIEKTKTLARSANLHFRVGNTLNSALEIEQIVAKSGGFVQQNNLQEQVQWTEERRISKDSTLRTTHYRVEADLLLRIPVLQLDTSLRQIGRLATVLHHRNLEATDVTLDLLNQQLSQLRGQVYSAQLSSDVSEKGEKLNDITAARERQFQAKKAEDLARIERMRIEDRVAFSTVTVRIYQPDSKRFELIPFEEPSEAWSPSFFAQIADALGDGWKMLCAFVIWAVSMWSAWLVLAVALFALREVWRWWKR